MKDFEVTLTNGTVLKVHGTDYSLSTNEKGSLVSVTFRDGEKEIAVVNGTTFSHVEITSPHNGS